MKILKNLTLPIIGILAWEALAIYLNNPVILPKVESVISILLNPGVGILGTGNLIENTIVSIKRVLIGFFIAGAFAIPLGLLMGYYSLINDLFDTTVELLRPIPPLAWVPLALAWFGIGESSMHFIIFIGAFFPILINTISGVKSVPVIMIEAAKTLGGSTKDILKSVVVPASSPDILTGLRVGAGIAWMCVVAAEMLPGSDAGLGYLIMYAYSLSKMNIVVASMIIIGIIGIILDKGLRYIEKKYFCWKKMMK
ncbi:ABC transporter permease [Methanococcus maripaludis]|uniref:Transport permease protein n=5 Tax=Methanococcus maripaludis TaxID=39152 RepID=Q6LXZ6_METMP|nr:ABC transporter permease [Methanococcus maripaludis]AEK20222.1 binding-protein-dependent transport systems inner membrane component [Methanococcus maripaludis X1]MBA2847093.1 NitT/TauT family transport system permease protein [Methanococcus maripaludis]MBA2850401.1 NitT/TauT family transport system permease protein [Methanococcus maripaludis]MBM7409234.1 NitT/TauT family transport system permease protein [Methanococcus maripaludis]MBP2218580.1 NitT/TauT family transport system permease prot